jgi:hypothetical protein
VFTSARAATPRTGLVGRPRDRASGRGARPAQEVRGRRSSSGLGGKTTLVPGPKRQQSYRESRPDLVVQSPASSVRRRPCQSEVHRNGASRGPPIPRSVSVSHEQLRNEARSFWNGRCGLLPSPLTWPRRSLSPSSRYPSRLRPESKPRAATTAATLTSLSGPGTSSRSTSRPSRPRARRSSIPSAARA